MVTMPGALRVVGRREDDGLAEELDRSRVGAVGAREDLEQRRLARAVFAEQRVNFGGTHFEMDVLERLHAGKRLLTPVIRRMGCSPSGVFSEHRPASFSFTRGRSIDPPARAQIDEFFSHEERHEITSGNS